MFNVCMHMYAYVCLSIYILWCGSKFGDRTTHRIDHILGKTNHFGGSTVLSHIHLQLNQSAVSKVHEIVPKVSKVFVMVVLNIPSEPQLTWQLILIRQLPEGWGVNHDHTLKFLRGFVMGPGLRMCLPVMGTICRLPLYIYIAILK